MKILIMGGDGFMGWPTSLYLASRGHDVVIVDNGSRRKIEKEIGAGSLTPIETLVRRVEAWDKHRGQYSGRKPIMGYHEFDIASFPTVVEELLEEHKPGAIIHFAEQRSAPYSMRSAKTREYTIKNNTMATSNILSAITQVDRKIHLVHIGTMGVYGYGGSDFLIPEGYVHASLHNEHGKPIDQKILYPANPGSIYHLTKCMDALQFQFYAKNYCLRITDLHQGIVWGTSTEETDLHPTLVNRFDYDGDYGTVLNRFAMQAALGYPLTVHGTGGQTRAFIHIRDSMECIELALKNPPYVGFFLGRSGEPSVDVKIFNQMTETHRVLDLAMMVSKMSGVPVNFLDNPRKEARENTLMVSNREFTSLGLKPTFLTEKLVQDMIDIASKHLNRVNKDVIKASVKWEG